MTNSQKKSIAGWITIALTVLTLLIGATVWASSEHAEIKDWTAEQDFVTKTELRDVMKDQDVPKHEFSKVEQSLEDTRDQIIRIQDTLEKMDDKLDKISSRRNR